MKFSVVITLIFSVIMLASCFDSSTPTSVPSLTPTPTQYVPIEAPSGVSAPENSDDRGEERPIHIDRSLERLSFDLGIPKTKFIFITSEPVEWADTSLGCPEAGWMYAQVITPGHKVIFQFEGMPYVVHTDKGGLNTSRCAEVSPTPTPTPTPIQDSGGLALTLKIIEIVANLPDYDRNDWKHWADEDSDCQNTRHEVLIGESIKDVAFKTDKRCQVAIGEWLDPYAGVTVTDATTLDVDHMVPLKNAHDSGGWAWGKNRKAAYANEMGYAGHLIAVTSSANRKKGAKGPEQWKPSNRDYWCNYAIDWVQIKVDWDLSVTKAEWAALQEMLKTCDRPTSIKSLILGS